MSLGTSATREVKEVLQEHLSRLRLYQKYPGFAPFLAPVSLFRAHIPSPKKFVFPLTGFATPAITLSLTLRAPVLSRQPFSPCKLPIPREDSKRAEARLRTRRRLTKKMMAVVEATNVKMVPIAIIILVLVDGLVALPLANDG